MASLGVLVAVAGAGTSTRAKAQPLAQTFTINGEVRAEYDNNVARGSRAVADMRGIRQSDIKYTPSLTISGGRNFGSLNVFLNGRAGYEFYQYNDNLKRERINLSGGTNSRIGQCSGGLLGSVARGVSDTVDLGLDAQRSIQRSYSVGGNIGCPLGGRIGVSVSAMHQKSSNSGGLFFVDSTNDSASMSLSYGSPSAGSISLIGSVAKTSYEDSAMAGVVSPGFENYTVGLSYARPIGARLTGTATLSYFMMESGGAGAPNQDGLSWNVGLAYVAGPRLNLNTSLARSLSASNRLGANSSIVTSAQLNANYTLSTRMRLFANARVNRQKYGVAPLPGQLFASKEESRSLRGGVQFDLGRFLAVDVEASVDDVDTDLDTLDYTAEKVAITARTRF